MHDFRIVRDTSIASTLYVTYLPSFHGAESNHSSAIQEISCLAWNLKVHYHYTYNSNKMHTELTNVQLYYRM